MTKIVVLSDSHGNEDAVRRVLECEQDVSTVIYLGDGMKDVQNVIEDFKPMRLYAVLGNCDFFAFEPREGFVPFEKVLVYFTHGHLYGVKYDLSSILQAAKARKAHIVLFGHTHKALCETREGVMLFNPGSCGRSYTGESTYGVLTIADGKILSAEHKIVPQ